MLLSPTGKKAKNDWKSAANKIPPEELNGRRDNRLKLLWGLELCNLSSSIWIYGSEVWSDMERRPIVLARWCQGRAGEDRDVLLKGHAKYKHEETEEQRCICWVLMLDSLTFTQLLSYHMDMGRKTWACFYDSHVPFDLSAARKTSILCSKSDFSHSRLHSVRTHTHTQSAAVSVQTKTSRHTNTYTAHTKFHHFNSAWDT